MRTRADGWQPSRPPTVAEIDRTLALWDARIQQVDENLLALEALDVVQRLQGTGYYPPVALEGLTKTRVEPALATLSEIFAQRSAIATMLDSARAMRQSLNSRWPSERTLNEIGTLLYGPSVVLSATKTPLAKRGLLTASLHEQRLPPEELLARMSSAFETARDTILAVERAWDTLDPMIEAAVHEVQTLEQMAFPLGTAVNAELTPIRLRLASVRQRVERDPLGIETGLIDTLVPMLRDLRDRLTVLLAQTIAVQATARALRDEAEAAILRARVLFDALRTAHADAYAHYLRCQAEIAPPDNGSPPPTEAYLTDLASWLQTLERTAAEKHWHAATIGVQRWQATAQATLIAITAAHESCTIPLAERDELLGRLIARHQQVHALRQRGVAINPALERQAVETETFLRQHPLSLHEAKLRVARYERDLYAALHPGPQA